MKEREIKESKMTHTMNVKRLPIIDPRDPAQLAKRLNKYFDICHEDDKSPTLAGMALAIGISRVQLLRWMKGETPFPEDCLKILEEAGSVVTAFTEVEIAEGKGNPVGKIFLLKNNFEGYNDTQHIEMRQDAPMLTERELLERAARLPGWNQPMIEEKE